MTFFYYEQIKWGTNKLFVFLKNNFYFSLQENGIHWPVKADEYIF
jgi:hypothetical protein